MIKRVFITESSWATLFLRLTMGIVMLPHGAQKLLGWFDGPGFSKEMEHLQHAIHLPGFIAFLVIIIEFFGSLMLILGICTRLAAFSMVVIFIGMIVTVHGEIGFFMNWFGKEPAGVEGFEFHLLAIGISIALLLLGGGKWSIDRNISLR